MTTHGWVKSSYNAKYCKDCKEVISTIAHTKMTPEMSRKVVGLGIEMPFKQASEAIWDQHRVFISATWVKNKVTEFGKQANFDRMNTISDINADCQKVQVIQVDGSTIKTKDGYKEGKVAVIGSINGKTSKINNCQYLVTPSGRSVFERELKKLLNKRTNSLSNLVCMGDGAHWIWKMYDRLAPTARKLLDFYHCVEHLGNIIRVVWGEKSKWSEEEIKWHAGLIKRSNNGYKIIKALVNRHKDNVGLNDEDRKMLQNELLYFKRNRNRMWYQQAQLEHIPIGTGKVESTHKWLIQSRLKRAGMIWTQVMMRRVLALRMIKANQALNGWMAKAFDLKVQPPI